MRIYGVYEELDRIYKSYLAMLAGDNNVDPSDFEADFLIKSLNARGALNKGGHQYKIGGQLKDLVVDYELVEVLNIIGLNGHRHLNEPLKEIDLITNEYRAGLLRYKRNPTPDQEMLYLNDYRCLVRVVVKAHHQETLQLTGQASPNEGRGCHLLVFENWMGNPSEDLVLRSKSEVEYLQLSTLRFWRLTDVDGFFGGNSYYRKSSNIELTRG